MAQRRRDVCKHRDLVRERAVAGGKLAIDLGQIGRQLVGPDIAHAGHEPASYFFAISCCISGCAIAGLIASNRPVALISRAIWRVVASAIKVIWVAVVTRATPSASNSATLGQPARTLILTGAFSSCTSRPIVPESRNVI